MERKQSVWNHQASISEYGNPQPVMKKKETNPASSHTEQKPVNKKQDNFRRTIA
jgi:hypothetical protein